MCHTVSDVMVAHRFMSDLDVFLWEPVESVHTGGVEFCRVRLRAASCVSGTPFISRCLFNLACVFRVPGCIGCSRTASSSLSEHSSLARFPLDLCCLRMCRLFSCESLAAMRLAVSCCTLCVLRVSPNCSMAASSSLSVSDTPAVCSGCGCWCSSPCSAVSTSGVCVLSAFAILSFLLVDRVEMCISVSSSGVCCSAVRRGVGVLRCDTAPPVVCCCGS